MISIGNFCLFGGIVLSDISDVHPPERKTKKTVSIIIIITSVLIILLSVAVMFGVMLITFFKNVDVIAQGVSISGVNVGGLTIAEAEIELGNYFGLIDEEHKIRVFWGDEDGIIVTKDYVEGFDITGTVEEAFALTHSSNIIKDSIKILELSFYKQEIPLRVKADEQKIREQLSELGRRVLSNNNIFSIDEKELYITIYPEKAKILPDIDTSYNRFIEAVIQGNKQVELAAMEQADLVSCVDMLYDMIETTPINAVLEVKDGRSVVVPERNGVRIDKNTLIQAMQSGEQEIKIPIIVTDAEVTAQEIEALLYRDVLGIFTTRFDSSTTGRTTNIRRAAKSIDGYIIEPGAEFSFNKVVGERTVANGFAIGKVYEAGRVVDGIGGGICQVSSTLYTVALYANLEITERTNHTFTVAYLPTGQDATVSYGTLDFRFKNNKKYPVKISAEVAGATLTIKIIGTQTDPDLKISVENFTIDTKNYQVVTKPNPDFNATRNVVTQSGITGKTVDSYKVYIRNGVEEKRELLHRSRYNSLDEIVLTPVAQTPVDEEPIVVPQDPVETAE